VNAHTNKQIPVVDVDQAFPTMVDRPAPSSSGGNGAAGDVTPQVAMAVRDVLGMRPRTQDPKAFLDALRASFSLRLVEGHVVADYVPRGAAVMSDLGAVTGGQASLYRRATMARAEILRILDGLTPLRPDADPEDMASYRTLVRESVQRLVDELGNPGGPRVQMVDMYFAGLTGSATPLAGVDADNVPGQLGALRDRFGLTDDNSNTVDDEAVRTSFWTLVDLVTDLQASWDTQKVNFSSQAGQGFLGTDLILLSRLMEAAVDQVDELERVLDSVLIAESERRTIMLDSDKGLTLDGLLTWLRTFLGDEGRRIAQDTGRDGIVAALAPMAVAIVTTFRSVLADKVERLSVVASNGTMAPAAQTPDQTPAQTPAQAQAQTLNRSWPVLYLPVSCCASLPAGMSSARVRVAVAGLCRLLTQLAKTAQRIGRFGRPILFNVTFRPVFGRNNAIEVDVRGINLRPTYIPAFLKHPVPADDECRLDELAPGSLILPLTDSSSTDEDSMVAIFETEAISLLHQSFAEGAQWLDDVGFSADNLGPGGFTVPAEALPLAVIDGERGVAILAPQPYTWPRLRPAVLPVEAAEGAKRGWAGIAQDDRFSSVPTQPILDDDIGDEAWEQAVSPAALKPGHIAALLKDPDFWAEAGRQLRNNGEGSLIRKAARSQNIQIGKRNN
jgi:hypothetical protein